MVPRLRLLGLFLLCAISPVAAQPPSEPEVTFTARTPGGMLTPEEEDVRSEIVLRMTCPFPGSLRPFIVLFTPQNVPDYATVIVNPPSRTISLPPDQCAQPGYSDETTAEVIVTTNSFAPAYKTFQV